MYTNVSLPFHNRTGKAVLITWLDYVVGERLDDMTVLHVRGWYRRPYGATYSFAGAICLHAERLDPPPMYDLTIMEDRAIIDMDGDDLATAIVVALDEHAPGLVAAEAARFSAVK